MVYSEEVIEMHLMNLHSKRKPKTLRYTVLRCHLSRLELHTDKVFIHKAFIFNNYSYKYYKTRLIRSRHRRTKREIVKGFNQKETKQGASKWIKVTWLKWPLDINVTSVINNFGGKHIQLPAHWSPFARETANSHGVTGCEYHLTVVLPCVELRALSVQKW